MGVLRHEKQQYTDITTLGAETLVPTANDTVFVENLRRTFDWIEGSTTNDDGKYVLVQSSAVTITATIDTAITVAQGVEIKKWDAVNSVATSYSPAVFTKSATTTDALDLTMTGVEVGDVITVDAGTTFNIVLASTATAGRWVASKVASVYTGTGATDILENGQSSIIDITVTGAVASSVNLIAVTNADTFGTNVFITSKEVVAADTVRVAIENQSGTQVASFPVNVSVIEF